MGKTFLVSFVSNRCSEICSVEQLINPLGAITQAPEVLFCRPMPLGAVCVQQAAPGPSWDRFATTPSEVSTASTCML